MGRISEETEERHVPCFFYFLLVVALCGLLVQPAQAEPVDSVRVEGEHQAAKQKKTEIKEITIYISGEHKEVVATLLDAIDQETTMTGVADFDSLSATYSLIGISSKSGQSSDFYGYYFRLTLPPATDIASVAGAYENLSYVRFVETEPAVTSILKEAKKKKEDEAGIRLVKKLTAGGLGGVGGAFLGAVIAEGQHQAIEGDDGIGGAIATMVGIWGGNLVGTVVGVSAVDPQDYFLITLAGSVLLGAGVPVAIAAESGSDNLIILSGLLDPIVGAMITSELSRKPPQARRVSVGLVPNLKGGLSAVATLRF